ncbi:MAG: cytochrome c biogenesis CcdA family protein [Acidimicrobiia bacterium]|nr:cytochrome c biogenesis CcdA family protein [Acidimicrobiia bacterium]
MIEAPIGLAFAAGLVATVNPCGFAMLPAYLSYFMGLEGAEDDEVTSAGVGQALKVGAIVSLGFLAVFGTTGLLINAGVRSIIDWIPYVALGVGVLMVILGIAMFRGYQLSIGFMKVQGGTGSRDKRSVFTFGVSYALASLSCTLPVFLSVVVGSIASANFISGFLTYIAYGVGMSVLLMALTLAVAFAKQGLVRRLRSMLPHVQKISAVFLVVAGIYITWFWADDLSSDAGEQGAPAGIVDQWSASRTNLMSDNSAAIGLFLGGLVVIAVMSSVLKRFEPPSDDPTVAAV